jgi:hypothetical protein
MLLIYMEYDHASLMLDLAALHGCMAHAALLHFTTLNRRLWSWLRSWLRSWLSSLVLLVCPGSLSRWCSGSISIALTRTGKVAANLAIAITFVVHPTLEKAVTTSACLLNVSDTPQAFAPTWAHASPSRRRPLMHKETMRRYIEIAGIACAWSAKGHLALHLEPMLHQHNI